MARPVPEVEDELVERVEALGFDLVQSEWAGSDRRPILRLRIDVLDPEPGVSPGGGVTVDDCAVVSRGLEGWLDGLDAMPDTYVLEVSSPGVERPLTRRRDWERFRGEEVAVKSREILADRATRLEGRILGLSRTEEEGDVVRLELSGGDEVDVPLEKLTGAHLIFRWT